MDHGHGSFDGIAENAGDSIYSFQRDIVPMFRQHCAGCHTAGGSGTHALILFDADGTPRHADAQSQMGRIILEIQAGRMPKGQPYAVTEEEFKALDYGAAAGGPDN
jgi:mono/diheme cytochrome c family protein